MNKNFTEFHKCSYLAQQEIKQQQLSKYYKDKGLTIIGLNDTSGVKINSRKKLLEYLGNCLADETISPVIINVFSQMFNKAEYINYLLESNLSLEDIKDLQINGMIYSLEKVMEYFHLPKFLGKVGYINKLLYRSQKGDNGIYLTDALQDAKEPIVIYSCGANDLSREVGNKSFDIRRDYKNRDKNMNYEYTLYKLQDPKTVKTVINKVEGNINNILTLNSNSDICVLGLFIPLSIKKKSMNIFKYAIEKYNEDLMELCIKYKLLYVDTKKQGEFHNKSKYISGADYKDLSHQIIDELYKKKIWDNDNSSVNVNGNFKIQNHKLWDLLINLNHDIKRTEEESIGSFGRQKEVYELMIKEVERQKEVIEKVLMKRM